MSKLAFALVQGKRESAPRGSKQCQGLRVETDPAFLKCGIDPYPRVPPGEYELFCDDAKVYLDPGLKVWKCRYRFYDVMREDFPTVFGFINLGRDNKSPGRRSRYYREWSIANGRPPEKRQRMSSRTFKGKFFLVRVDWVLSRQYDGKLHTEATRYSLVKEIIALACSGTTQLPSIEVHKPPSKVGFIQAPHSTRLEH